MNRTRWNIRHQPHRALTLVELLIVIVVMAILAVIALPMASGTSAGVLAAAARLVAADIEYAQVASIASPDDPRLIRIDPATHRYWIAAASAPNTPLDYAPGSGELLVTFGAGRAASLAGVTIQSYDLDKSGENNDTTLSFDMLGRPDQATPATITLALQGATITITVAPQTGEVSSSVP